MIVIFDLQTWITESPILQNTVLWQFFYFDWSQNVEHYL